MVAPQERYPVRPLGLQRQQPRQRLEAVVAPVHKVPQEDVVRIRNLKKIRNSNLCFWWKIGIIETGHCPRLSSGIEELLQVIELAVDVPADCDRRGHGLHIGLLQQ